MFTKRNICFRNNVRLLCNLFQPSVQVLRFKGTDPCQDPRRPVCTKKEEGGKKEPEGEKKKPEDYKVVKVYRFLGTKIGRKPTVQTYELDVNKCNGPLILDILMKLKEMDPTLGFRRSCREGICGSCAVMVDGYTMLSCIAHIPKSKTITIYPLPHMYVIRDLVVDMTHFYNAYNSVRPYLIRQDPKINLGQLQLAQSPRDNDMMVGLYECVLCSCCSTACPSYWWNGRRFLGPAALLHAYRWVIDSRDQDTKRRLNELRDDFKVFRCHTIMNCTIVCPKNLNPALAIANLKRLVAGVANKPVPELDPMVLEELSPKLLKGIADFNAKLPK